MCIFSKIFQRTPSLRDITQATLSVHFELITVRVYDSGFAFGYFILHSETKIFKLGY